MDFNGISFYFYKTFVLGISPAIRAPPSPVLACDARGVTTTVNDSHIYAAILMSLMTSTNDPS